MTSLRPEELLLVRTILGRSFPKARIYVFGSRAKGCAKAWSDLDLAILDEDGPVDPMDIERCKESFQESELSFRVDLVDFRALHPSFAQAITPDLRELPEG